MDILAMAKALLPKDSPWLGRIDQAQQLASKLPQSRSGLEQLMAQYGKSKQDVAKAMQMLQNPMVAGALNRIAPGMADRIRQTGESVLNEAPSAPSSATTPVSDGASALRDRLSKL